MGWRTATARLPRSRSTCDTRREVWLLPQPVRTARTAITGLLLAAWVASVPSSVKCGPRDWTHATLAMTVSLERSEYASTTSSILCRADQFGQILLGHDRYALGVERARQFGGIGALVDPGDLGGRDGDDLDRRIGPVDHVEVVVFRPPRE